MLLVSALWLAVVQALASLAPSAPLAGAVAGSSYEARARVAGAAESTPDHARQETAEVAGLRSPGFGDVEYRPSAPQRLPILDRTSGRSVPPLRSPIGLAALTSADLAVSLASVRTRAAHRVSHAATARGGHLPYYPTAPPLQG